MAKEKIDKVLVSILQRRFKSIVEEMSIALTMTTRSPITLRSRTTTFGHNTHSRPIVVSAPT